jgi:hypothetical protein
MVKGYKVFNPDWTCRGFQFEVGKIFEEDVTPSCRNRGFHFCTKASDCFEYYSFDTNNKVAEVVALGEVDQNDKDSKCCTNKIQIVREIPWTELLEIVNTGKGCTGLCNSGDWNSGDCNSGNRNSGDWNSGDCNSGDCNSGDCNSGNRNSGDWNSGDWNKCNQSAGVFCTETPKLMMFNKPTNMTFDEWRMSTACRLLNRIDFKPTMWIWSSDMTDAEKADHPEYKTCEGYLKQLDTSECCNDWWASLTADEKCIIQNMPNFDADIFFEITGIRV